MTPVVKLLRLMDGEKPAMGKVYDRMFMIGQKIEERNIGWKDKAVAIHEKRWEYLHSEMHAAGYALDPEFMSMASDMDQATQDGLISIIEKICLLEEKIEASKVSTAAADAVTAETEKVQARIAKTMTELASY